MRLYLDTCIVNDAWVIFQAHSGENIRLGDVKKPLKAKRALHSKHQTETKTPHGSFIYEYIALYYLLDLDDQWNLEFGSSPVMFQEASNAWRDKSALASEKKKFLKITYDLLMEKVHTEMPNPIPKELFEQVASVLPHRNDIEHVCQVAIGQWDFLITTDFKSILDNKGRLETLGIHVVSPLSFLETNFLTLPELVRTLHGSWVTLDSVVDDWVNSIEKAIA